MDTPAPGEPVVVPIPAREHVDRPTASEANVAETLFASETVASESTNVWPDEAAESAFLAESGGNGVSLPTPPAADEMQEDDASKSLPTLDELVQRIPGETREILDELFRAKFTTVRRVKQTDLKA